MKKLFLEISNKVNNVVLSFLDKPLTQKELITYLKNDTYIKQYIEKFVKNTQVAIYNIKDYKGKIGEIDKATYNDLLKFNYVIVQLKKDGKIDAYPIGEDTYNKYKFISSNINKDLKNITENIGNPLGYAIKNEPVDMVKVSDLVSYIGKEGKIEAPWGGTQDYDNNSYLVLNGDEVYVCQMDEKTGFPIGYERYLDLDTIVSLVYKNIKEKVPPYISYLDVKRRLSLIDLDNFKKIFIISYEYYNKPDPDFRFDFDLISSNENYINISKEEYYKSGKEIYNIDLVFDKEKNI